MFSKTGLMLLALVAALGAAPTRAQTREDPNDVAEVVVTARRIGVPVWRVGSSLILVGQIQAVPKGTNWRPEELERAVEQADSVMFPHDETASPADVARVIWRARSVVFLPKGKTLSDYVDPETQARIEAFRARGVVEAKYQRFHPWTTADSLLDSVEAEKNIGPDLAEVMRKAVRRKRKHREAVAVLTGKQMLDAYFDEGPAAHVPCPKAALDAAEAPPGVAARRIDDYTHYRVPAVMRSPVERAFAACWLQGGGERVSAKVRADWRKRLGEKADAPGVTLAVVPLRFLAEEGGLLDTFAAEGRPIEGPKWRD